MARGAFTRRLMRVELTAEDCDVERAQARTSTGSGSPRAKSPGFARVRPVRTRLEPSARSQRGKTTTEAENCLCGRAVRAPVLITKRGDPCPSGSTLLSPGPRCGDCL